MADERATILRSWHSPTAWPFHESGSTFDFTPKVCNERHLDVPCPSHSQTLLDSSNSAGAHQSTNFQPQTNNAVSGFGYGASKLYGDEIFASGCVRATSAAVSKTTSLEMIGSGNCEEVCIAPCSEESSPPFTPDPATHEVSENRCACISCLKINRYPYPLAHSDKNQQYKCRFPGCLTSETRGRLCYHEICHYVTRDKYKCLEQDCRTVTKEFHELKRHYKKHCTNPNKEMFSCPVSWCKYSGTNGFLRKDKLKSHYRNIHEGKAGPVKAGRVIKPATLKPRVSSVGNGPANRMNRSVDFYYGLV